MLIDFSVANFRSIKKETSFSMVSSKEDDKNAFIENIGKKNYLCIKHLVFMD